MSEPSKGPFTCYLQFQLRFRLLDDVNEWISYGSLHWDQSQKTFIANVLFRIIQKATKIALGWKLVLGWKSD